MTASDTSRVERSRSALIVLWVAQIAVASLVLLTGASKLASAPAMVVEFDAIGVGQWFRYVVGSIEVASAAPLAIPSLAAFGALLLIPIMIGAIGTHLFILGGSPAPAMVVLVVVIGNRLGSPRAVRVRGDETALESHDRLGKRPPASRRDRRLRIRRTLCGEGVAARRCRCHRH